MKCKAHRTHLAQTNATCELKRVRGSHQTHTGVAVIAREEEDGSALNEFRVLGASNGAGVIRDGVATKACDDHCKGER